MKKLLPIVALAAAVAAALPAGAAQRFELDTGLGLRSDFDFRGSERGPMGLFVDFHGGYRVTDEVDLIFGLMKYVRIDNEVGLGEGWFDVGLRFDASELGPLETIAAGYRFYNVTRRVDDYSFAAEDTGGNDTQEWYVQLGFDVPGNLLLEGWFDFDRRVGTYLRASIGETYPLGRAGLWEADLGAGIGFDWGRGVDTFRDANLALGLFWKPSTGLRLGPTIDLVFPSDDVDPGADGFNPVFGFQAEWAPPLPD